MPIVDRSGHAAGAARSVLAATAVVMSVGVVSASPVAAPVLTQRMSTQAYTLTASSALLNIPLNLLNMALSMPAWEVQAINRLADAMIGTGSWQVWGPTNVFGFDEWDPPKLAGVIDMMMPVQPFSSVFGDQANWWAKANLPMNPGCAAASGACPDFGALLSGFLKVPASQLNDGHQFPAVINPFTLKPTSWSGQSVKLDPGAAFSQLWNYLSSEPTGVQTVPIGDYFTVPLKLATSVFDAFYPFVQNSEWFNPQTPFSWAFRALAPVICPSCGPEPYDNPWLQNYPPKPAATRNAPAPAAAVNTAAPAETPAPAPAPDPAAAPTVPGVRVAAPSLLAGSPSVATEPVPDARVYASAPSAADTAPTSHRGPGAGTQPSAGTNRSHERTRGRPGPSEQA